MDVQHETLFPHLLLEFVARGNKRYQRIRNKHYVKNRGAVGMQVHFLIWYKKKLIGIISGASPARAVASRDAFFAKNPRMLTCVINNTVFHSDYKEEYMKLPDGRVVPKESVSTQVLKLWRLVMPCVWFSIYGAIPIGFETFVVKNKKRKGKMYFADNWTFLGMTAGSAKTTTGIRKKSGRKKTRPKMIFARLEDYEWMKGYGAPDFKSSWRGVTQDERRGAAARRAARQHFMGRVFFSHKIGAKLQIPGISCTPRENAGLP
jgi:hypothetical protein